MFSKTKPMDLGDIFSNTFKLLKETLSRNIIIACAFLIPTGILMAYGFDSFFSAIMEYAKSAASAGEISETKPDFSFLLENIGTNSLSLLIFLLGNLGAMIGITKISWDAMNDKRITIGEAFSKVFSITFLKTAGQSLLLFLAISACVSIGFILIAIGSGTTFILLIIIGAFALIAGIVLTIYLVFRWYFAFNAIVCEDTGTMDSFSKSSFLIERNWWRTFGIVLLFSVIVDFAVSIITTPITFIAMWDFFSQYFKMIAEGNFNENDPEVLFKMFDSFGFAFGIILSVSTILDLLITPPFNVVYYFDLKIRKRDFPDISSTDNLTPGEFLVGH